MKCPECKGDGWIPVFESGFCGKYACPTCRGTGEVTLTNEEWFCSLSTEEKAEWITEQINKAVGLALHDAEMCDGDVNEDDYMNSADDWVQWLKDVHKE